MRFEEINEIKLNMKLDVDLVRKQMFIYYQDIVSDKIQINKDESINYDGALFSKPNKDISKFPYKISISNYCYLIGNTGHDLKGSPKFVKETFQVDSGSVRSLEHCPKYCHSFSCGSTAITTLKFVPESCVKFSIKYRPELELLNLFKIDGLTYIKIADQWDEPHPTVDIMVKILSMDDLNFQQKVLMAKRELIKHGYESNAKL